MRCTDYLEILHDQEQVGDRADMTVKSGLFGMDNATTVGFDINKINFTHLNNSPYGGSSTVNAYDFDPGSFFSPPGVVTSPRLRTNTTQYALFGELSHRLYTAVVGDRRRALRPRGAVSDRPGGQHGLGEDLRHHHVALGHGVPVQPNLSVYAQYATATDPLGALVTTSDAQRGFDLATGKQLEVGVKQAFWGKRGEWTLAAYEIRKNDLLSRDPVNPTITQQVGQQSSRGLEVPASVEILRDSVRRREWHRVARPL